MRSNIYVFKTFAGLAGLAISLALTITQSLNWSVRMASDLESQMVRVLLLIFKLLAQLLLYYYCIYVDTVSVALFLL